MKRNKKTILFAHNWWNMGGAENVLFDWMSASRKINDLKMIDLVNVGSNEENSCLKEKFKTVCDEQYALDGLSTNSINKLRFVWNLIKFEKPDVIYIMTNPQLYSLLPFINEIYPKIKIVDLLHAEDFSGGGWFSIADEYKEYLDRRIVISDFWKEIQIKKYKENFDKVICVYNSVDLKIFNPNIFDKKSLRKKNNIDNSKFVVGFIGRFDSGKNPMVFLKLAELMSSDERFQFCMIGGGGEYDNQIKEKVNLLSNVKYLGKTKNPEKIYPIMDLMVFPSVFEGYPLVGMESAAMNIPIIASDVPGFHEQITEGKFGFLYQQDELEKDAKKIMSIIYENLNDWKKIGSRGRKFVEKYHDKEKQYIKYKEIIESLLK